MQTDKEETNMDFSQLGRSSDLSTTKRFVEQNVSRAYADHRPSYSAELFQVISDFCRETVQDLDLAIDVGCGPGNSTVGLTRHFKQVIGVDVSETQIACAPKDIPNCQFKMGYSHQLPFIESGSVDLFSSGEAFHYFPIEETFAEADRVLRPGGTIAIFGYREPVATNDEINDIIKEVFLTTMFPYFSKTARMVFDSYRTVNIPYPGSFRNDTLKLKQTSSVERFIQMLRSFSTIPKLLEDHPNFLKDTEERLTKAVKAANGDSGGLEFEYHYNIFLLMGHKPKP